MEINVSDKVKEFNDSQKYTQKVRTNAIRRLRFRRFADKVEDGFKKVAKAIPETIDKIKDYHEARKTISTEGKQILDMYDFYLEFASTNADKKGIEVDPKNKDFKVIYTNYGPIFIAPLENESSSTSRDSIRQAVEGFLPDDDGFIKYFNCEMHSNSQNKNNVNISGYTVDPEKRKVSLVDKVVPNNNKTLFYINKQTEIAKKFSQTSGIEKEQ